MLRREFENMYLSLWVKGCFIGRIKYIFKISPLAFYRKLSLCWSIIVCNYVVRIRSVEVLVSCARKSFDPKFIFWVVTLLSWLEKLQCQNVKWETWKCEFWLIDVHDEASEFTRSEGRPWVARSWSCFGLWCGELRQEATSSRVR